MGAVENDNPFYLQVEHSPDAIFVTIDDQFSYLNDAALKLFGAETADQLLGQTVYDYFAPSQEATASNLKFERQAEDRCAAQLVTRPLDDGVGSDVEVSYVPVRFPQHSGSLFIVRERREPQHEVRVPRPNSDQVQASHESLFQLKKCGLYHSSKLQERILTVSVDGMIVYRSDGQCILANPAAAQLVGCTEEDLLQQNFRHIESWRDSGLLGMALQALQSGQTKSLESHLRTSFGKEMWVFSQFSSFEHSGETYLLMLMHDISQFKHVEKELVEREQHFRTLAENVPDNISRHDLQGRALYINPTLEKTIARKASDIIGVTPTEHEQSGEFDELEKSLVQVARTGEPADIELYFSGPDGNPQYHLIRSVPERDADGNIVSVLSVGRDLTERKQAQEELRLAASVFHNSADGVMITDAEGKFVSVNPAFTEITGFTEDDVQGQTPRLLRSNRQGEDFYKQMWQSLTESGQWQGELWNRRKDGEAILIWNTINRIDDEQGQPARYVSVFHDVTELRRKDEHIHHLAFHDALTEIPNRILFLDRLQHAMALADRENSRLAVIMFDLDRFKYINDALGHETGDLLLQEIAQRVKGRLRSVDTLARLYGDEFVILTEDLKSTAECAQLVEELLLEISRPMELKGQEVNVGASLGIVVYPDDGGDYMDLLKHADMAMYAAKSAGRNTYRFFQQDMLETASKRLSMEMELRRAISGNELVLYYQPKLNLKDDSLHGMEALVRWQHPQKGLIPPAVFVPLAEECGLILELGVWVIQEACRQIAAWQDQGYNIRVAINVSSRQLDYHDLAEQISEMSNEHGISPSSLEVELTESTVMKDPENVIDLLGRLRKLGVTVAVDDFGTGYSSLAYLRRLPIDVLKIDRSFVQYVESSTEDAQIVKTVIVLGHSLKFKVVAEGIENIHHANVLRWLGCDIGQGYFYSKPLPVEQLQEWLDKSCP